MPLLLSGDEFRVQRGFAAAENEIEICVRHIDNDGAGRFSASIGDDLPLQSGRKRIRIGVRLLGRRICGRRHQPERLPSFSGVRAFGTYARGQNEQRQFDAEPPLTIRCLCS